MVIATLGTAPGQRLLPAASLAVLLIFAVQTTAGEPVPPLTVAPTVSATYWHQAATGGGSVADAGTALTLPQPVIAGDLARVRGADVLLVFVESYGAVTLDRPVVAAPLAASRNQFEADARASGRRMVSAMVDSPTFGGGSWLAHVSLMTGVEARDERTNQALMSQRRDTMVSAFAQAGYRTVALMPGLRHAWPEGAFYGFDTHLRRVGARLHRPALRLVGGARPVRAGSTRCARSRPARPPAALHVLPDDQHPRPVRADRAVPARLAAAGFAAPLRRARAERGAGPRARLLRPRPQLRQRRGLFAGHPRRLPAAASHPRSGPGGGRRSPAGCRGRRRGRVVGRAGARRRQPRRSAGRAAGPRVPGGRHARPPIPRPDARVAVDTARVVRQPARAGGPRASSPNRLRSGAP